MSVFRNRFVVYSQKGLIDRASKQTVAVNGLLRAALLTACPAVPETIHPGEYQVDCDTHDFEPCCRHLLVKIGERLGGYLRIIHDQVRPPLPLRELYEGEYQQFKREHPGAGIIEISRFVVPSEYRITALAKAGHLHELSLQLRLAQRLLQILEQYARSAGVTDILAQVHPSHAGGYVHQQFFKQLGPEKPCPLVNNSPAVLLHRRVA